MPAPQNELSIGDLEHNTKKVLIVEYHVYLYIYIYIYLFWFI
jgi:hypothetical protein